MLNLLNISALVDDVDFSNYEMIFQCVQTCCNFQHLIANKYFLESPRATPHKLLFNFFLSVCCWAIAFCASLAVVCDQNRKRRIFRTFLVMTADCSNIIRKSDGFCGRTASHHCTHNAPTNHLITDRIAR